jgi:hypothetical protein
MMNSDDKGYEQGTSGTNKERQSDSLKEYLDKEPMTQAKINAAQATTVKEDPDGHQITSEGQSRISTERGQ